MTSLGEEHNPYAAPQAELQVTSVESASATFHPMSPRKAAVMSMLTSGFYDLVFWYRHWARLKESGHNVTPLFRAFFGVFTSFSFVTALCTTRADRGLPSGPDLRGSAGIYLGLNIGSRLSDKFLEGFPSLAVTVLACAGCAWVLATIQRGANEVTAADSYQGPYNSGVTVGTIIAGAIGLVIWFGLIALTVDPDLFGPE